MVEQLAKKLMSWASILEDGTREQALRTASLPFIHPWVALMPDAHLGRGATVGSVIPTLGAIIPAAVGVDIGCGMIAVRSQFTVQDVQAHGDLATLRESIEAAIPLIGRPVQRGCPRRRHRAPHRRTRGARGRRQRRDGRAELASPAGQPRLGEPFHRGQPGRGGPRLAVLALRVARGREPAGGQAHQDRQGSGQALVDPAGRPRSGLPGGGRPTSSRPTCATCTGRSTSRC